jgi:release factor glutamine methyltransferase
MTMLPSYIKRSLLEHVRGHQGWIDEKDLSPEEKTHYALLVQRFTQGEPLSRIIGTREFWSLPFRISPATLDPRADSETLIEAVLAQFPDKKLPLKVLDMGTGSGCLLLATLSEYPNATGIGTDIQAEALETARTNAKTLALDNRCEFIHTSWAEGLSLPKGYFDVILCNPPYIREDAFDGLDSNVKDYDPYGALVSGKDGLECYRAIMFHVEHFLSPKGFAFLEIGQGQGNDVSAIGKTHGLNTVYIRKDLGGIERCLVLSWISQR